MVILLIVAVAVLYALFTWWALRDVDYTFRDAVILTAKIGGVLLGVYVVALAVGIALD